MNLKCNRGLKMKFSGRMRASVQETLGSRMQFSGRVCAECA